MCLCIGANKISSVMVFDQYITELLEHTIEILLEIFLV